MALNGTNQNTTKFFDLGFLDEDHDKVDDVHDNATIDYLPPWYIQAVYVTFFGAMVLVSVCGNSVVIWIVLAHKRMRTVTNYFLVNLAVSDLSISLFNTLFVFISMLFGNVWFFGEPYCKFTQFISHCSISTSVLTFVAIAIDRYVAIIHPLKPRMPQRVVLGVIAGIWLASATISLPMFIFSRVDTPPGANRQVCRLIWPDGGYNSPTDIAYQVFLLVVNYFLPLVVLIGTYSRVGVELWSSTVIGDLDSFRHQENIRSKRKVVKMMIVVVIIFSVCWLPQHLYFIITSIHEPTHEHIQHIYMCIYWLAMSFAMYNPIIYCWMNARFRKGFKYIFRWCPFVKWTESDTLGQSYKEEMTRKKLCYSSSTSTRNSSCRKGSLLSKNTVTETVVYCEHESNTAAMTMLGNKSKNGGEKRAILNGKQPSVETDSV